MTKTLLYFLILTVATAAMAQEGTDVERPKIGLVLSGGGAKGMAHIGALKVLEEAGVKIDYIGGTSMGAFVGALYAAGYTADQLDSIFRNTNFDQLIRDNLPRSAKTFYEKEDSDRYALTLPFKNFRVSVPPAYSGGQNIYNELVRVLYHAKDIHDFNELPIPFLCIATNAETGEQVLLDKGYLPEAVLASGTLPSLFEPVILDGKILIDGGVVNNYPLDEVKKLGADIIIGVDVQHGLSDREGLLSATEILLQINNFRTAAAMTGKSKRTDIYIKPSLDRYSVIDFNKYEEIVRLGEVAARNQWEALKLLSGGADTVKVSVEHVVPKDSLMVNRLIIDGNLENYTRGYIKGKLRFNLGEKTTFKKLDQGISNLSATGNFKTIHHKLTSNGIGEDLTLILEENPNKNFLRLGLHYDDLYKSAALANLTKKRLLMKDDVASFDFILGDKIRYHLQYYVDKGTYWSFGLNSRYNTFDNEINFNLIRDNFDVPGSININTINIDINDFTNQLYLQTVWREEFAFTIGAEHKWLRFSTQTLGDLMDVNGLPVLRSEDGRTLFEKSNYYSTFGQLVLDTYDDRYFPKRGLYFNGDFHLYLFSSDFNDNFKEFSIAKASMGGAIPLFKNLSLNLETEGGFKLGTSNVTTFDFVLGGYGTDLINNFVPFLGYDFLSLPGNSYVKAYGRLDLEFTRKNHLLFSANFANVEDDIFRTGEWFTEPNYSGYGLGYGWESFLGPVQVMYSWSPEARNNQLFFSVGYWF